MCLLCSGKAQTVGLARQCMLQHVCKPNHWASAKKAPGLLSNPYVFQGNSKQPARRTHVGLDEAQQRAVQLRQQAAAAALRERRQQLVRLRRLKNMSGFNMRSVTMLCLELLVPCASDVSSSTACVGGCAQVLSNKHAAFVQAPCNLHGTFTEQASRSQVRCWRASRKLASLDQQNNSSGMNSQ